MNPDKRDELYNNLINSGKVSEAEIGSLDDFKAAITDENSARAFHKNLIGSGIFGADEIGNEDDFYSSISSDFAGTTPTQRPVMQGAGVRPTAPWKETSAMPEDVAEKFAADEKKRQQATTTQEAVTDEQPLGPENFQKQMEMQQQIGQMAQSFSSRMDALRRDNTPFSKQVDALAPARQKRVQEERAKVAEDDLRIAMLPVTQSNAAVRDAWVKAAFRTERERKLGRFVGNEAARLKYHDLDRMSEEAWNSIDEDTKQRAIRNVAQVLREDYGMPFDEARTNAEKIVRGESDRMMYDEAVKSSAPKNWLDYLTRKINENAFANILEGWARSKAGTVGDMQAREAAEEQYRKENWLGGMSGEILGFAARPENLLFGGAAGAAGKGVASLLGKEAAEKLIGKIAQQAVTSSLNLGTFFASDEATTQFKHGGAMNEDGTIGDYSLKNVGEAAKKGALTGLAIGPTGQLIGNAGKRLTRATESTIGKVAVRSGQELANILAEGTIFVAPEMLKGELTFDDWLGSVGMMAGFKLQGGMKSAPERIRELAGKRGNSRQGFETRLRTMLDRDPSMALTKDEKAELERGGYNDLKELVEDYKNTSEDQRKAIETKQPIFLEPNAEGEIPYNRFIELVEDKNISEAARAKMYYYVTGHGLPMSTVLGSTFTEQKDANGNVTGYEVQSLGLQNGVITSRNFKNRKEAELELERINRQAELNGVAMGEQAYNADGDRQRMDDAYDIVAKRKGITADNAGEILRNKLQRKPEELNEMEKEWAQEVKEVHERLPREDYQSADKLREDIDKKYNVNINDVISKEPNRRSDAEEKALKEYVSKLAGFEEAQSNAMTEASERGYNADEQERREAMMELAMSDPSDPDRAEKQAAVEGVNKRIEDDADMMVAEQRDLYNKEKNDEDGALHPATMIVDGEPREVYVKNGLVTNEDGTIDAENSSETIVVYDPVEGKNKMVSPKDLNGLGEVTTAEQFESTIQQQRADFIQKQQDAATGRFNPQPGQIINMPEGDAVVLATDGESVTMQMPDGTQKSASIADIQQIIDGVAMEDYRSRHPEAEQQPAEEQASAEETTTMIEGKPDSYEQDMEVTVKDGDEEKKVYVTGQRARVTAKGYVEDPEGRFVEYYVPGENRMMYIHENDPEGRIVGYKPVEKPAEEQAETPAETTEQMPEQPTEAATEEVQQPEETTSISSVMPMKKVREKRNVLDADGNPVKDKNGRNKKEWVEEEAEDWYAATPEDAYTYLYDEAVAAGLKEKEADGIVKIMQEQAQKELADIKKKPEPVASSVMATLRLRNERDAQIEEAQSHVDYWKKVNSLRNRAIMERREATAAERRANETAEQKAQREAYEAEQAQRQAEAEAAERRRQEENEQKAAGNFEAPVEAPENMESVEGNKTSESPLAAAKRELKDDAEAMEILNNTEPQTLEEVASTLMRSGKNQIGINPEDFYRHTGYSPRDGEKFKFILSNNGVSISRLGEMVEAAARNEHIPFDENDANAGFNAVLKVLGDVRTQGEINSYITNKRIQQAREHHDAMLAQEDAYMAEQLGVTAAEYEAWVESMEEKAEAVKNISDEEFNAIFGYDETLLNNENIQNNDRRAETDNGSTGEEGADALQEEQREGEPAGTSQDDTRGVGEDAAAAVDDNNGAAVEQQTEPVEAVEVEEAETPKKAGSKIDDVGEKIGGARKDLAQKMSSKINLDADTFPKMFPKFDLKKMVEQGLDPKLATAVYFLRMTAQEEYKRKAKRQSKSTALGAAKFFAAYAKRFLENGDTNTNFTDEGWVFTDYGKKFIDYNLALFDKVHEKLGDNIFDLDLSGYAIEPVESNRYNHYYRRNKDGVEEEIFPTYNARAKYSSSSYYMENELDKAIEELTGKISEAVSYKESHPYELRHYYNPGKKDSDYVGVKIGGKIVPLTDTMPAKDLRRYMEEHEAELQEKARRIDEERKQGKKEGGSSEGRWKPELNLGGKRSRVGEDYRNGRDVTADEFRDTFGFRGVEFGNYVTQKERQKFLNEAYDALMDMAKLLDVSPKALSLGGQLGFAIGARGGGKNAAHYEPALNVINLTKTQGAGALAHEWWHAMDYYFNREGDKRKTPAMANTMRSWFKPGQREEIVDAFVDLVKKINDSDYFKRSVALETKLHPNEMSTGYYDNPTELGARAFQDYVQRRLTDRGQVNDFLSSFTPEEKWNGENRTYPYPTGDEANEIDEKFDNLFSTMQEKTDEAGNVLLYHKADSKLPQPTEEQKTLTKGLVGWLNGIGIKTHAAVRKGQEVLNKYRELVRALRAYHGSGADFDRFDHSHMGEGEGAQAYGYGTYVTEVEGIGRTYAESAAGNMSYRGKPVYSDPYSDNPADRALFYYEQEAGFENAIEFLKDLIKDEEDVATKKEYQDVIRCLQDINGWEEPQRVLYTVEIPDDNGHNYLDWVITIPKSDRRRIADVVRRLDGEPAESVKYPKYTGGWEQLANMIERNQWAYQEVRDRLVQAFGGRIADEKRVSDLMHEAGFVGVKYPAEYRSGGREDNAKNYVIFDEGDLKIVDKIRFQRAADGEYEPKPVFYSNAMNAVEGIKQEKATAEQWLAMLQKNGGLKAGEDKWIGLSDWLNDHKGKSLTKQEVLDYIKENQIEIEEVDYEEGNSRDLQNLANRINDRAEELGMQELSDDELHDKLLDEFPDMDNMIDDGRLVVEDSMDGGYILRGGVEKNEINPTRLNYTTDFLDNKKEIAFVVPNIESWHDTDEVHFGDAGEGRAVMWVRFGETTDKDGKKVLVIDEIQSNRHQQGREKGYVPKELTDLRKQKKATEKELINLWNEFDEKYGEGKWSKIVDIKKNGYTVSRDAANDEIVSKEDVNREKEIYSRRDEIAEKIQELEKEVRNNSNVPDAPFDKNWHEVAFKRMLRYAAENGYDKVAWTTGEQQAERYNIGNVIDRISVSPLNDRDDYLGVNFAKEIFVKNKNGEDFSLRVTDDGIIRGGDKFNGENVKDIFGKELAEKIMSSDGRVTFEGDNLRIGAEGMKGFYDQILPRFADKYGKKWNVKTTDIDLPNIGDNGLTMHSVDVTPEMKASVLEGQPMFFKDKDGEVIGYTLNGEIYIDPRYAKPETPVHEYTHLIVHAIRANNPQVWERWKQLANGEQDVIDFVKAKYPEYSENEDDFWEEVISNYTGREGGKRLEEEMRKQIRETPDIAGKARIAVIFNKLRDLLKRFWDMTKDIFSGSTKGIDNFKSMDDVVDLTLAALANKFDPRAAQKAATEARDKEYMEAVENGDVKKERELVDEAAKTAGYTIRAYHGTARRDRVGNVFRPERATSGPMAFFTDSREIAENYSKSKPDTSIGYDSDYDDYETQFRAKHKATGKDYAIWDLWGFLPMEVRAKLREQAGHIRENWEGDGSIIYDPATKDGNGAFSGQVDDYHGNVLRALTYHWLKSGQLYGHEADFLEVLDKAGVNEALENLGFEMPRYLDPEYREEGVYDVYLKMENPLDATEMVDEDFIDGFEDFAAEHEDEYVQESRSTDGWDKNDITAEDFADNMRRDLENDRTDAWTAIPDVMTAYLKSLGYDGIKDAGGKNSAMSHTVYVPFSSEQVKSAAAETYDDEGNLIPLSKRFDSESNDIRFQKYTTKDGVQLSMMSLFEGDVDDNDNLNDGDNANGDITNLRLRKLQPGETCHVERRYEESKQFSFIGKEKIESMDDVAYIFKQLETAAVENSFVVLVKDGKPTIIHTGMGSYTEATVDFKQAFAAYKEIQPDAVYVVHNHPSGTLKASKPDYSMLSTARRFFGSNVVKDGIIIDTVSGKYCTFGWSGDNVETMPESADGEMPVKVYQFSKQVFGPDWKPLEAIRFFDSRGIAEFVSSHRLGEHPKMSFIVVNKQNQVVGNYFLPWTSLNEIKDIEAACAEMSNYINLSGGTNGVLYGNYEYSEKDRRKLQKLAEEMRALGMSLLDVVHVDVNDSLGYHSAHDSGVMEPESKYEVPAREAGESLIDYAKRVADDYNAYEAIVKAIDAANSSKVSEPVTDQDVIERLEAEPKIKVYRSMQLIDGKLYPPMSAKVEGQLRQPSNIGEWEQSEEMPDMVDENGKFKLDKGNKKSLKAAYNPYIHGATTMLNDQFSEAQDRPNLVVVEMEVPVSELTSGYRAEKAKDSVGMMPWKAGVIQGKLTGKRDVMLSRWAKPVRIVPVEEVAENIANQIEGQIDVMPSNVVTPQVRKALENLGVKFVETDNTGKIKDGENKGKTWASVYGKNLDKVEKKETASIENKVEEAIKGGYKIPKRKSGEGLIDYAQRVSEEYSEYAADNGIATVHDDGTEAIDDRGMDMQERMTAMATRLAERNKKDAQLKYDAYRAIGGNLADLRKAMSLQKEFDKNTVKRVADLARILISGGYFADATKSELSRLLSAVKNATGKSDISSDIRKVMDVMIENQLRNAKNALEQMEKVKASKVDARGVEVQGVLDVRGQQIMKTFKEARGWSEDEINQAMAEADNRMVSDNNAVADQAMHEYDGLQMALEYVQNIKGSIKEESDLKHELMDARSSVDRSMEYENTLLEAIQQNRAERVQAYYDLMRRLGDKMRFSIERAREFKEAEKERVREIQHNANSDMEGRPSDEHYKPEWKDKMVNNSFVQFLFSPLATFDQMMRLFGSKSANGEGYLYNRFMRGWVDAREKELRGVREKYAMLDEKVHQLFGNDAKSMADLIRLTGRMPKATVLFKDGGEMKEHQLTQGNMMYIYMVNKMLDGRMKLRKMGIDEKAVSEMMRLLDPRLIELADWMQEEFLVDTRNEYNETHKRLFGAPMAAIEHYFPLKINANARVDKAEDLDDFDKNEGISTKTGSIIKRRMNALALDVTNADALNVILDHVAQMEHWNAFAEFNRDLNTLRTYKRFRNQVKNMTTIYGSGDKLWEKFNDMSQMVAGTYRPKRANLDVAATNVAKGVTAAKVSFRVFTALKQFLSMPAYIPDARPDLWAKNLATPWKSWSWAMENLPIFEERWKSRIAGDPRLLKSELDWKGWRNNVVQLASKIGMSPNAFVDALTVSIGAKTIYESRKARYMKEGYSEEQADKRAKQDAEVAYNQTQQSSEGAFLSTMQVDRSWLSVMFTVFRNSSMAYQRQLHDAIRNLKRDMKKGNREESIEFMKKQMVREGVPEDKAEEAAKERYNRQVGKDVLRVATFGYILQFCWNLGAVLPYLLFGGDDDKKDQMWDDVFAKSFFGWGEGLTGGDVMSEAGKMAVQGKGNPEYLKKEMPAVSDAYKVLQEIGQGKYGEVVNDMVNLVVQAGVGVNPQSITDAVLAIMDACGNDPKLAHEATIAIMRILQVPQSQIKEMYFDEIGLSGDEVSKYTPAQLAERYAKYQVKRGRMIEPWTWNDEGALAKQTEKANKAIKERVENIGGEEANEAYNKFKEQYDEYAAKLKEYRKSEEYRDATPMEKAQWLNDYYKQDPQGYMNYSSFKDMDAVLNKMVGYYLGAHTAKEAQACYGYIEGYKQAMVDVLSAESEEARKAAREKRSDIVRRFYEEVGNMQKTGRKDQKMQEEYRKQMDKMLKNEGEADYMLSSE